MTGGTPPEPTSSLHGILVVNIYWGPEKYPPLSGHVAGPDSGCGCLAPSSDPFCLFARARNETHAQGSIQGICRFPACTSGHNKMLTSCVSQTAVVVVPRGQSYTEVVGQACVLGWFTVLLMDPSPRFDGRGICGAWNSDATALD